jgi:polysaccharide biosynthesis transport protein
VVLIVSHTKSDHRVVEYPTEVINFGPQSYKSGGDTETVDIRAAAHTLWRGRWTILSIAALFGLVALLVASRAEPTYQASATVMFGIEQANITDLQQLLTVSDFDENELENQIQVLHSKGLLTRVAKELDLQNNPDFNPALEDDTGEVEGSTDPSGSRALATAMEQTRQLLALAGLGEEVPEEIPSTEADYRNLMVAVEELQENLVLTPVTNSTVIELSYTSYSPELSADIVNTVAAQYIVDQLQVKLETTNAATEWLTSRVEELRQRVQTSEEAVETLRTQLSVDAGQGLEITQQQLAALNAALSEARGAAASAEARFLRLSEAQKDGRDLSSESAAIREYRDEEGDLLTRRNTLSANHPAIPQIDAEIAALRTRMQEEAARVVTSAEVEFETAQTQVQELERAVRDLESKALDQSRDEIRIRQLDREAQANRLLYENLLVRLNETSEQEDLQSADVRILSAAEVPVEPESQKAIPIMVMAGILGGFLGIGIVVVRDNLNNTFRAPRQIEDMTGQRVLATLPALRSRVRNRDLVRYLISKPTSSLAEAVRNLRTSILRPNAENPPKVIMFTSSIPGEGKSTTSMLTAITSQQMGKSAIIVDCDLRLSSAEQFLDARDDRPGILSVLNGSATLEEALYEDPATGLHVLMVRRGERSVKSHRNAADILSSEKFAELIRYLSHIYDVVILDTPPVLVVTDARIIAALADTIIYVVRWNKTPRDAVAEGLRELDAVQAPLFGTVLSMVNERKASKSMVYGYTHHRGKHGGAYYTN